MDWQQPVALGIVGLTVGAFIWSKWRRQRVYFQRGHCGCGSQTPLGPPATIIFRGRRGERPEILMKSQAK